VINKRVHVNKEYLAKFHTPQNAGDFKYSGGTTRFTMTLLHGVMFCNSRHVSMVANLLNVEIFFILTNFSFSHRLLHDLLVVLMFITLAYPPTFVKYMR
jgi:hypothetical protein